MQTKRSEAARNQVRSVAPRLEAGFGVPGLRLPDPRRQSRGKTLIATQHWSNNNAVWEIAVPNGNYSVHLVAGDPTSHNSVYRLAVEGLLTVDGTPNSTRRWIEGFRTVSVTDGRLTITNASGASNNKLCFVEIAPA